MDRKVSSSIFDTISGVNADMDDLLEEEDANDQALATKTWRDDFFLRNRPLMNEEIALEYFCNRTNPFYSKKSTEGIRYSIDSKRSKSPTLYIVKKEKVEKKDKNNPKLLNLYYIAAGIVYQSPSIYDVIQARSFNALNLLNQTFKEIQPFVEYSADDTTNLKSPAQPEDQNIEDEIYVASIPPYSMQMQNHVSKLIDMIDMQTNALIQEKQNRIQQQQQQFMANMPTSGGNEMMMAPNLQ
ncbi:hypothetical protein FDP41_002655 [Naegleria fowleri]|uniref:Mediator of RNA polymerase II transcription subunit 6 n=1 Tax=Naegleria fowleri TaxID=5763 RepID=A0A6A5BWW0_NAEFO|nr:uncharacterized protein FDP41_002655 [Naegleria fowleri]KAF0978140.1 hypothetical protein FDP41_002655 [Naegleria fowleri]